ASIEVLERAGECTFIHLHIQACESGQLPEAVITKTGICAGKAVVYAPSNSVVPEMLDQLVSDLNANNQWPAIADLPHVGDRIRRVQPVVTVFAEGNSLDRVEAELRQRVETIQSLIADS